MAYLPASAGRPQIKRKHMIFPIGDDQVHGGYKPIFTYLFLGANILVFLYQVMLGIGNNAFVMEYGSIPLKIMSGQDYFTLFTSMFLHGGWMHLVMNMLFLWVFADNIEATIGNIPFVLFYLTGGMAASLAHILFNVGSTIPCIGASGAISAVLGAYLVMFPKSKIKVFVIYLFSSIFINAIWFLGFWFAQQFFSVFTSSSTGGGVAWWAHIGGFVFGAAVGWVIKQRSVESSLVA